MVIYLLHFEAIFDRQMHWPYVGCMLVSDADETYHPCMSATVSARFLDSVT